MLIVRTPVLLKTGAPEVVDELLPRYTRLVLRNLVGFQRPSGLGHGGKYATDGETVSAERQVQATKEIFQVQTIGLLERPIQQVFGNFKSDEIVIALGCVVTPGDLKDI